MDKDLNLSDYEYKCGGYSEALYGQNKVANLTSHHGYLHTLYPRRTPF